MFVGPTGVGKTHVAKELAKYLFDTEEALLRLTDAGMTVYRTDMQGNILITVD